MIVDVRAFVSNHPAEKDRRARRRRTAEVAVPVDLGWRLATRGWPLLPPLPSLPDAPGRRRD